MLTNNKAKTAADAMGEAFGLKGRMLVHELAIEAFGEQACDMEERIASLCSRMGETERVVAELRRKLGDLL